MPDKRGRPATKKFFDLKPALTRDELLFSQTLSDIGAFLEGAIRLLDRLEQLPADERETLKWQLQGLQAEQSDMLIGFLKRRIEQLSDEIRQIHQLPPTEVKQ